MEKLILASILFTLTSCTQTIPGSPFANLKCDIATQVGQHLSMKIKEQLSCHNTVAIQKDFANVLEELKICEVKTVQSESLFCKPVADALLRFIMIKAVPGKWECDISGSKGYEKLQLALTKACQ